MFTKDLQDFESWDNQRIAAWVRSWGGRWEKFATVFEKNEGLTGTDVLVLDATHLQSLADAEDIAFPPEEWKRIHAFFKIRMEVVSRRLTVNVKPAQTAPGKRQHSPSFSMDGSDDSKPTPVTPMERRFSERSLSYSDVYEKKVQEVREGHFADHLLFGVICSATMNHTKNETTLEVFEGPLSELRKGQQVGEFTANTSLEIPSRPFAPFLRRDIICWDPLVEDGDIQIIARDTENPLDQVVEINEDLTADIILFKQLRKSILRKDAFLYPQEYKLLEPGLKVRFTVVEVLAAGQQYERYRSRCRYIPGRIEIVNRSGKLFPFDPPVRKRLQPIPCFSEDAGEITLGTSAKPKIVQSLSLVDSGVSTALDPALPVLKCETTELLITLQHAFLPTQLSLSIDDAPLHYTQTHDNAVTVIINPCNLQMYINIKLTQKSQTLEEVLPLYFKPTVKQLAWRDEQCPNDEVLFPPCEDGIVQASIRSGGGYMFQIQLEESDCSLFHCRAGNSDEPLQNVNGCTDSFQFYVHPQLEENLKITIKRKAQNSTLYPILTFQLDVCELKFETHGFHFSGNETIFGDRHKLRVRTNALTSRLEGRFVLRDALLMDDRVVSYRVSGLVHEFLIDNCQAQFSDLAVGLVSPEGARREGEGARFAHAARFSLRDACLSLVKACSCTGQTVRWHPVDCEGATIEILDGQKWEYGFRFNRILQDRIFARFLDCDSHSVVGTPFPLATLESGHDCDFVLRLESMQDHEVVQLGLMQDRAFLPIRNGLIHLRRFSMDLLSVSVRTDTGAYSRTTELEFMDADFIVVDSSTRCTVEVVTSRSEPLVLSARSRGGKRRVKRFRETAPNKHALTLLRLPADLWTLEVCVLVGEEAVRLRGKTWEILSLKPNFINKIYVGQPSKQKMQHVPGRWRSRSFGASCFQLCAGDDLTLELATTTSQRVRVYVLDTPTGKRTLLGERTPTKNGVVTFSHVKLPHQGLYRILCGVVHDEQFLPFGNSMHDIEFCLSEQQRNIINHCNTLWELIKNRVLLPEQQEIELSSLVNAWNKKLKSKETCSIDAFAPTAMQFVRFWAVRKFIVSNLLITDALINSPYNKQITPSCSPRLQNAIEATQRVITRWNETWRQQGSSSGSSLLESLCESHEDIL